MPAWLTAALPAAISGAASLFGGERQNRLAREESERNRQFQERMRNTAWQASVEDMRAAGLNPALAYSKGPAASPGGSMASQIDSVTPAVSSAMQAKRMVEDLRLIKAQREKVEAESRSAGAKADLDEYRSGRLLRLMLTGSGEDLLGAERLLQAELGLQEGTARRMGAQASALEPVAAIADAFIPIIRALSNMSAGGLQQVFSPRLSRMSRYEGKKLFEGARLGKWKR